MILIVGDSHAGPLARALEGNRVEGAVARLVQAYGVVLADKIVAGHRLRRPFFVADDDAVRMTGSAGATLSKLFGIESFRSDGNCYGFSMGFHSAMFLRQEFWADFTLLPDVEGKAFVSAAVYKAMVLHDNAHVLDFAQALVERSVDAFFLAGAPIREAMIQRQAACASRPEMLAIQARYLSTMAAAFRSAGVRFVPAPPTAMSGGVLLSMYDSLLEDDVHHGNPKFAALQWELIAEELLPRERAA